MVLFAAHLRRPKLRTDLRVTEVAQRSALRAARRICPSFPFSPGGGRG
jgi:hypothetical protein